MFSYVVELDDGFAIATVGKSKILLLKFEAKLPKMFQFSWWVAMIKKTRLKKIKKTISGVKY